MKLYVWMVAAVLFLGAFLIWRAQPEQVIKRRCKTLIGMVDRADGGAGLFDLNRLEGLLADTMDIQVDVVSAEAQKVNRIEVLSGYQWLAGNARKSDFEIEKYTDILIEQDRASVSLQVSATLEMDDMRLMQGLHDAVFIWRKDEKGEWRLERLSWNQCM